MGKPYYRRVDSLEKRISPKLGQLDMELTERCNNNCIHCYINQPKDQISIQNIEMTTTQVKDFLRQAAELGCLQVRFTGGEPLLRPDFEEIFIFACRLGLRVILFTNGRQITEKNIHLFKKYSPLLKMELTMYGLHKNTYDSVTRVPDSFQEFWQGMQLLRMNSINFVIKYSVLPNNKHEIEDFESWIRSIPSMPSEPNYSLFFSLRTRRDDEKRNNLINKLRIAPKEGLQILTREEEQYRKSMSQFAEKYLGPHGAVLFSCGAGSGICIDAYGKIQPCMGFRHPGYMYNGSRLSEALSFYKNLKSIKAINRNYLERCAVCFLHGLCEQCPAKSWEETGTVDTPVEYFCQIAHAQARYLGWIGQNEFGWEVPNWRSRITKENEDNT
jgi:radical SAM protein with 4Fe4S-binding SPASM domain